MLGLRKCLPVRCFVWKAPCRHSAASHGSQGHAENTALATADHVRDELVDDPSSWPLGGNGPRCLRTRCGSTANRGIRNLTWQKLASRQYRNFAHGSRTNHRAAKPKATGRASSRLPRRRPQTQHQRSGGRSITPKRHRRCRRSQPGLLWRTPPTRRSKRRGHAMRAHEHGGLRAR